MPETHKCAYYQYDADGERFYKNAGLMAEMTLNGQPSVYREYDDPVLYASPYLVATQEGYTKHYFVENERIASRIGEGIIFGINSHAVSDSQLAAKRSLVNQTAPRKVRPEMFRFLYTLTENWSASHTTYWQHSDHLGSANWVTDTAGTGYQFLLYMPWGEPFVDLRKAHSSYNTRYTFSGKERDEETGYSYFGARYYNSDLSIWLSVDPMADKYPGVSPYAYCGNNPVRLVDPDGREIWIVGEDGNRYQYKDGSLYTDKGVAYSGKLKGFAKTALTALNRINKTQMGEELICELQESTEVYSIKKTNGNSEFINHSNSILWNTDGALLPVSNTTLGERFATGDLAHELSHAYDHNFNMTDEGISFGKDSGLGIENSEWLAVYRENLIRHELNKPYRTHYMVEVDKYNNFIGGTGPSMLKDGHPYLPFIYPTVNK